jgi:catechol 2,3-dioxygenase-like lactoylglutathione lyase family enzyme
MIKTHVSINVSDVARSIEFYRSFFGMAPHKVRPGYANFDVANPPLKIALVEKSPVDRNGVLNHLGLLVEDTATVLAIRERLHAAGLPTVDEMNSTCCYAKQDKIWVQDPDGTQWEVYALTDDLLEKSSISLSTTPQTTCCTPGSDSTKCC